MARKPRSKTATRRGSSSRRGSARAGETAHQRRIREYLRKHPGATKAEARGHKEGKREHVERERRAKREGRLTEKQRAAIKRFATKQAQRKGVDVSDVYPTMTEWAQAKGYGSFERLRDGVTKMRRDKRSRYRVRRRKLKSGKYSTTISGDIGAYEGNVALMDELFDDLDLPDHDWLYYH